MTEHRTAQGLPFGVLAFPQGAADPQAGGARLTLELHDDQEGIVLNEALRDFASRQRQAAQHGHEHLRAVRTSWALVADRLADRVDRGVDRP